MRKLISGVMLTLMLTLGFTTVETVISGPTIAHADDLSNVMDSINNNTEEVMGSATKNKITALSNEIIEIILVVVMAVLLGSGLVTATLFANVKDNPQKKATLKTALIYQCLGIVFLASFFGFMKFGFENLKLFK